MFPCPGKCWPGGSARSIDPIVATCGAAVALDHLERVLHRNGRNDDKGRLGADLDSPATIEERPMEKSPRTAGTTPRKGRISTSRDAIALLKADHRQVERWFGQFKKARASSRKGTLAGQICGALKVHMRIEEEIFYPAFLAATGDRDMHHEAEVEHAGAKKLIAEIDAMSPAADYYDAKLKVLSEMIKHHVKEEEQPGGMFAEARKSGMDLDDLGREMRARRQQLRGNA